MSTIGQIGDGNLLVASLTLAPVAPVVSEIQTQFAQFEISNAAVLAASIGLGVNVDTWA